MLRTSMRAPRSSLRWLVPVRFTDPGGASSPSQSGHHSSSTTLRAEATDLCRVGHPSERCRDSVHRRWIRHINFASGGIKGMEGFLKQEKLREKVEQMQDARAKAERYAAEKAKQNDDSTNNPEQPHPPPWEAPPPPMGVQAMAEARITEAMNAGVLDNLAGKGKPLARDASTETPWDVDAGNAALNRVLKAAGYKPASVDAMNRLKLKSEVLGKVLARFDGATAHAALLDKDVKLAYREKESAAKEYNQSLIVDQEQYGSGWPLRPAKIGTLEEHVVDATRNT